MLAGIRRRSWPGQPRSPRDPRGPRSPRRRRAPARATPGRHRNRRRLPKPAPRPRTPRPAPNRPGPTPRRFAVRRARRATPAPPPPPPQTPRARPPAVWRGGARGGRRGLPTPQDGIHATALPLADGKLLGAGGITAVAPVPARRVSRVDHLVVVLGCARLLAEVLPDQIEEGHGLLAVLRRIQRRHGVVVLVVLVVLVMVVRQLDVLAAAVPRSVQRRRLWRGGALSHFWR